MPAGDLVVADYQCELRTTLMGDTTDFTLSRSRPFSGLGQPRPKTADLDYTDADGSYGGKDRQDVRVITVAFLLEDSPTMALGALEDLRTIWASSTVDLPFYIRLPGMGRFFVNGRPRGLTDDIEIPSPSFCRVDALATFVCLNPTITAA